MYIYLSKNAKGEIQLFHKWQKSVKKGVRLALHLHKILYICHDKLYINE